MSIEDRFTRWGAPIAWKGSKLRDPDAWTLRLGARDNAELRAALAHAKSRGADIPQLTAADFPLPDLAPRLAAMLDEVMDGRGFVRIAGFEINTLEVADAARIYWGIGSHLGIGRAQNAQGDLLGHVTDLGLDYRSDVQVRGYQTRLVLPFHNDAMDIVGLMCLHPAKSGGLSRIVSSAAIHDAVLERRPDLLRVMYEPFAFDRRGETPAGKLPYYVGPFFERLDGRFFGRFNRTFVESAQRFGEVPRLSAAQRECLDLVDALCADPELHLDMELRAGDIQFISNYTTLHSRTEYDDWPERERRRYLLRLWLDTGRIARMPPSYQDRYDDMAQWQHNPQPPLFDLSARRAELAH